MGSHSSVAAADEWETATQRTVLYLFARATRVLNVFSATACVIRVILEREAGNPTGTPAVAEKDDEGRARVGEHQLQRRGRAGADFGDGGDVLGRRRFPRFEALPEAAATGRGVGGLLLGHD